MKKNYMIVLGIFLIMVFVLFQYSYFQKVNDVQYSIDQVTREISAIRSDISQQIYQLNAEKADYILDGVMFTDSKFTDDKKKFSTQMKITFSKLPANAICSLEVLESSDHYPIQYNLYGPYNEYNVDGVSQMKYSSFKTVTLLSDQKNIYTAGLNLSYEKNYEYTFVIETPMQVFREKLGAIPVLEWTDPIYNAEVNYSELGVRSPDDGYISYNINLYRALDQSSGNLLVNDKILIYPDNERLNSKGISSITYKVLYENALIKEGILDHSNNSYGNNEIYEAHDTAKFTADMNADLTNKFIFEFTITDAEGKVTTFERKLNY
ncbi:hypothetical protein [Fusibacter bizertensis]